MNRRKFMKQRKIISIMMLFFMMMSFLPANIGSAWAAEDTSMSDMDALSALGIDSSAAPEGFDEDDTSNPYGKDTMTVNPVSELYAVGLSQNTNALSSIVDPITLQNELKDRGYTGIDLLMNNNTIKPRVAELTPQYLRGTLYGHNGDYTSAGSLSSIASTQNIASGSTTVEGDYYVHQKLEGTLHPDFNCYLQEDGYNVDTYVSSDTTGGFDLAASKVVNANFDGNTEAQTKQAVLLYTGEFSENGGLYMSVGDIDSGIYGSSRTLIPTSDSIGNPSNKIQDVKENFMTDPYLMQNYLQVTAGDYDGDGTDEIAVFIPEYNNSRIAVYKLKKTTGQSDTAYRNPEQWELAWTYSLVETSYVSNMVSLVSGDFNEDGITDLGATWGYYYGPANNNGSKAVVMFGAKGEMLQDAQEFDLDYGQSEIVRASFTFGDLTGSGDEVLVLGGQYSEDLKNNIQSRYVALYTWNGTEFVANTSKNFDLFKYEEDDNGDRVYENEAMAGSNDQFYSSSLCPANIAVLNRGLSESPYLYLDSLLIEYGDQGLEIKMPLDQNLANSGNSEYYVEYGAVAGDFSGDGYDTIATMQQTTSQVVQHQDTDVEWHYYYKNWWHKWIGRKTYYTTESTGDAWTEFKPAQTAMVVIDAKDSSYYKKNVDTSTSICLPNTDDDTTYMRYTGDHYFKYTDPEVLAVLASPPYFSDLLNRDDLSGSYAESSTSYSSTKGSGGGQTYNSTIEVGAYVSVEQEFSVFGVVVASAEAEQSITKGFTHEAEKMSTMEQTVSYTATAGEDMIAFYSIPLEVYEYTVYTPNGDGTYDDQKMEVNIPHIAAVQLISLDSYENIAKDYDILPQISGTVLTHELGDPSSYPASDNGYLDAVAYNGVPARVGFSSNEGGASIGQEIVMTEEESSSYSVTTKLDSKAGAGAGGVKVGVTFGSESGAGTVTTSTSGNSFSGEMQNMPVEAEEFGYSYCWRIFSYLYDDGKVSFPVVNYLVEDITAPSGLPDDFEQNVEKTTDTDIAFTWSYDKMVAGFQIYRYYEFPDGSGSYELKFIPMTDGVYDSSTGAYDFEFIDSDLSPYTDYQYQIQTVRAAVPNNSIPSEVISARTKTDVGYPHFGLEGLDIDGYLRIYPDSITTVKGVVENAEDYPEGISYQWQKLVDGVWTDMPGKNAAELTFTSSGSSDQGSYRCRTNVIYFDSDRGNNYYISSYSDLFETKYSKRIPVAVEDSFTATTFANDDGGKGVNIELEFISGNTEHYAAPQGNVTFTVKGTDYVTEYTVALEDTGATNADDKFISQANLEIDDLPDGVYEVEAYYSGNRVFKSLSVAENSTFLVGKDGYQLILQNAEIPSVEYTYGDEITPTLKYLTNDDNGVTTIVTVTDQVTYTINNDLVDLDEAGNYDTLDVGKYTIQANLAGVEVATREFSVLQREISVEAFQAADKVGKGEVESKLPELKIAAGTMAFEEELGDLDLMITAVNTAGNPVTLNNETEPGNYTITGTTSRNTDRIGYNNYKVMYISGVYTIIGQTYPVNIIAEQYMNRNVGTITLSNTDDGLGAEFSAGTELLFFATPYAGYEVDYWTAQAMDSGNEIVLEESQFNASKTRLSMTMNAEETTVKVFFKKAQTTLTTAMEGEGTVECINDSAFTNGGNVNAGAEMKFTATPNAGYTFKEWKVESNGSTQKEVGNLNEDGSNTLTYEMGSGNTVLRAVFERDSYTITLADNLEAVYEYILDEEEKVKKVYSGAEIVGDTEVLVKVRSGYDVAETGVWLVDGNEVNPTAEGYRFNIGADTSVDVETVQLSFDLTTIEENGTISVEIDGEEATELTDVAGGSKVVFTAHPAHGYAFDSFTVSGSDDYLEEGSVLTFAELGASVTVEANFTKSTDYVVTVDSGSRANASYILYDAFGDEVERGDLEKNQPLDVVELDKIKIIITPHNGYMVDKWIIDGNDVITRKKEIVFEDVSKNMEIKIETISQTSYTVNYGVGDGNGSIFSATTDGFEFASGFTDVGGNSKVVFKAEPNNGYMVDRWTLNGETILNDKGTEYIEEILTIESLISQAPVVDIKVYFEPKVEYRVTANETDTIVSWECRPDVASNDGNIRAGGIVEFTVTPKDGYRIVETEVTGVEINSLVKNEDSEIDDYGSWKITTEEVEADVVIKAIAKKIHAITVDDVEGGNLSDETTTSYSTQAVAGELVEIYQDADLDYTFAEWHVKIDGDNEIQVAGNAKDGFTFLMPDNEVVISASFGAIEPVDISYEVYDKVIGNEQGLDGSLSVVLDRAGIEGYPKTVAEKQIAGAINSINRGYEDDYVDWPLSEVTFTADPDKGYRVWKWTIDGKDYFSPLSFPVVTDSMNTLVLKVEQLTEDTEVIVQFEPIGNEITYAVENGNGSIVSATNDLIDQPFISGNIVTTSTDITLVAAPSEGYEVAAWLVDGQVALAGANNTFTYHADGVNGADIKVSFGRVQYEVEYSSENGSIISEIQSGDNVRGDSEVTFNVEAEPGYRFDSYEVNGSAVYTVDGSTLTVVVTGDIVVTANFVTDANCVVDYTVVGGNGELSAEKGEAPFVSGEEGAANDVILFTAMPDENYKVKTWTIDGSELITDDLTYELTVAKAIHNVTVEFERSHYVVDFNAGDNGNLKAAAEEEISTGKSILIGEAVSFTANPNEGYQVKAWSVDGEIVDNSREMLTYEISELAKDTVVTVEFEEIPEYEITINIIGAGIGTVTAYVNGIETPIIEGKITVKNHDQVRCVAVPKDEFNAAAWSGDDVTDFEITGLNIEIADVVNDGVLDALFKVAEMLTVKADAVKADEANDDVNGNISVKAGYVGDLLSINAVDSTVNVTKGKTVEFRAEPEAGYMVKEWFINDEPVVGMLANTLTRVPETDIQVKVTFEPIVAYAIPANGEHYNVSNILKTPDELPAAYDDSIRDRGTVTFMMTPDIGYYFEELDICGVDCLTESGSDEAATENIVNVSREDNSYTITLENVKQGIEQVVVAHKPIVTITDPENGQISVSYTIINDLGESEKVIVDSGESVPVDTELTITAIPDDKYSLSGWGSYLEGYRQNSMKKAMPKQDITLSAVFQERKSSGGGSSSAAVTEKVTDPVMKAVEDSHLNSEGKHVAMIEVTEKNNNDGYEQEIPKEFFGEGNNILNIITPKGTVTMPDDMFAEEIEETVQISIDEVDEKDLDLPASFKGKPIIDINLEIGGQKTKWASEDKEITISIPYELTETEKGQPHKVIAVYIDDDGNITPLTSSDYDEETGAVVFKTKHTSYYSVQYSEKSFADIGKYEWAKEAIESLAARGIINGVSDTDFAPQSDITRADFVVLITRFFDLEKQGESNFSDVDPEKYYYDAVATAKAYGIITGSGNNQFDPQEPITRQDMMVIMARAFEQTKVNERLIDDSGISIENFVDAGNIADYAQDSVDYLIQKGIVSGDGVKIDPINNTKRAEVAALLYKAYNLIK